MEEGSRNRIQKIVTYLWFENLAEEAARFYTSVFKNSSLTEVTRYGEGEPGVNGSFTTVTFRLEGQTFIALNSGLDNGAEFKFNEAMSLYVNCTTQEEVDELWNKLREGGEEGPCGWLKDKYGIWWQIIPIKMMELLRDPDTAKSQRVMQAMLKMKKIDITELERAYGNKR
jgi:predicted 3-demethylubiquinone-9 3-methyltransferase (glyoxalase superfamily)